MCCSTESNRSCHKGLSEEHFYDGNISFVDEMLVRVTLWNEAWVISQCCVFQRAKMPSFILLSSEMVDVRAAHSSYLSSQCLSECCALL